MTIDDDIDRLVVRINSLPREALASDDAPPVLRRGTGALGFWDWQIKACDDIDWIEPLESRLATRFPPSFRSLVTRYQFPKLELGPLILFANTSDGADCELRDRVFRDPAMSNCLLRNGLVQFAVPNTGSYDPVCFDSRRPRADQEYPILWIDHEAILCNDAICPVREVAVSFHEFVSQCVPMR